MLIHPHLFVRSISSPNALAVIVNIDTESVHSYVFLKPFDNSKRQTWLAKEYMPRYSNKSGIHLRISYSLVAWLMIAITSKIWLISATILFVIILTFSLINIHCNKSNPWRKEPGIMVLTYAFLFLISITDQQHHKFEHFWWQHWLHPYLCQEIRIATHASIHFNR